MRHPAQRRVWSRAVPALLAGAAFLTTPASLIAQRNDQRIAPEVRELELTGVERVSKRDLERSIATSESECKSILFMPFCWVSRSPTFWDREYLDRDEFRRDVLRVLVFYWKRGFREAAVDTAVTSMGDGRVRVTFAIREGPPTVIGSLRVEYDSTLLDERRVRKLSILRAGDPLNLVVLDTMRLGFLLDMWDKGYADAQVDTVIAVDAAERRAAVLLRVQPNWLTTVGQVTVRGNTEVDVRTIQNSILLRSGEVFRYSDLTESQRNLYESNLFRLAMLTVPPRLDSIKDVTIDVRETKMREARMAMGFTNVDFVQGDARFTHYNMFGGARRLDLSGTLGNLGAGALNGRGLFREMPRHPFFGSNREFSQPTWSVSADLKQPAWLRRPENALSAGVFAHRRAAPAVYIDRGYGSQLSFTRTLAPRASASGTYRFEITRVEASDVYYCANYGVCDGLTVASLRRNRKLSPVLLSASIDRSDRPFSPTKGFIARVDLDHASGITASDYRYNRGFAEASVYTHFRYPSRDPRSQVLAAHTRLGIVRPLGTNVLHPRTRFYAGGSQSVRGYGPNELGPKILTISSDTLAKTLGAACDTSQAATVRLCSPNHAGLRNRDFTVRPVGGTALLEGSVEYRMPVGRKVEYAAFLDGAIVGGSAIGDLSDSLRLPRFAAALTPGVGFRYRSPVGPIRVDVGYNPRTTESLPVLTTATDSLGRQRLVALNETRRYTSGGTATGFWKMFNRLVLHLSIGQAY
jgi:outer membrane protein assembly factor BamA